MRVHEVSDGLCLATKLLHSVADQPHLQDFDGVLGIQMNMLAEVHIGEATLSDQTDQTIVADLLSISIFHFTFQSSATRIVLYVFKVKSRSYQYLHLLQSD